MPDLLCGQLVDKQLCAWLLLSCRACGVLWQQRGYVRMGLSYMN